MKEEIKTIECEYGIIEYIIKPKKSTKEDENRFYKLIAKLLIETA